MINVANMDEILSLKKPGDLFSQDEAKAKDEYRRLARIYHPDHNKEPRAEDCFKHITALYNQATTLLGQGRWERSDLFVLKAIGGNNYSYTPIYATKFELGTVYFTEKSVVYILDKENENFFTNAKRAIGSLSFKEARIKETLERCMPRIINSYKTDDGKFVLELEKPNDVFPLDLVKRYCGDTIDSKHVAWIISRLMNIACYLNYSGISHNGITISNCFICPEHHSIVLLGGWWYSVPKGATLIGTQKSVFDIMPVKAKANKTGMIETDLESIRDIGRKLIDRSTTPDPFLKWLDKGAPSNPVNDYGDWTETLEKSYGPRKFVVMNIEKDKIYKEK